MPDKSDLPFASEFSPSQINLPFLLELANQHGGNRQAFVDAIRLTYFKNNKTTEKNKRTLANNSRLGMIAYGLIDTNAQLTPFGQTLYALRYNDDDLYAELGKHILLNLNGAAFVQCIQDMHVGGETIDLTKLRDWLAERGIHFPRGGKHPSMMRLWLEKGGVFTAGWRVDQQRFESLLGMSGTDLEVLSGLSAVQKAYLKALVNVGGTGPFKSNEIERLATNVYGVRFNEKSVPKDVLYPLQRAGFIDLERGEATPGGRGGRPFLVAPTTKLDADVVKPLLAQLESLVASDLRPFLRKPLDEIVDELDDDDKHRRGLALEALAIKLMRLLDLTYVSTRLRGDVTGGAEVDVVFETARLVFSRWQVQCKNTGTVSLDDVAKEVGLTHFLKSNVIVIVSTGTIGSEARRYALKIMTDSNLCIVMVDREDMNQIVENPTTIADVFNREAQHAMKIKALDA